MTAFVVSSRGNLIIGRRRVVSAEPIMREIQVVQMRSDGPLQCGSYYAGLQFSAEGILRTASNHLNRSDFHRPIMQLLAAGKILLEEREQSCYPDISNRGS